MQSGLAPLTELPSFPGPSLEKTAHLKKGAPWELSQILPALCQLPPVRGPCRGLFYRYFYNDTSSECERFTYSGCQGNDNNFETAEICVRICKPPETR
ncbi:kunitz-type protease inhibitor 3 isoform X1 [Mustela erminea]|uniref:kunitz-type protease inhibitor 3 isoform X1 n=1 Tax=Mustela erminea TaxID=36723 RepID=UPI0013871D47|nr:kunitz-type protease inhibitor 3 isoform X1 [Mustela erminea]XP_032206420.1 kunitz-type protease inhibitor 3 isoform X1 [Mustela erminea]